MPAPAPSSSEPPDVPVNDDRAVIAYRGPVSSQDLRAPFGFLSTCCAATATAIGFGVIALDHTPLDGDLLDLCGIIGIAMMGTAPLLALLSLLIERRRVWLPIGTLVYVTLLYCVLNR